MNPNNNDTDPRQDQPDLAANEENRPTEEAKSEEKDFSNERQWADILGMKFDPEEARRASTPPPYEPAGSQPQYEDPICYDEPQTVYGAPQPQFNAQPPQYGAPQAREPMPPTYLVWAIISTLCCCLPAGIVAIIFSANVSSKYYARDFEGARRASRRAEWWIIISIVLGIIGNTIFLPLSLLMPS